MLLVYDQRKEDASATPPAEVTMFRSYLGNMTPPEFLRITQIDGKEHLLAYGLTKTWFPQGPPIYVFGPHGNLLAWTLDSFDDPNFARQWLMGKEREVSVDQARTWITQD